MNRQSFWRVKVLLIFATLAVLSGCSLAPDYVKPKSPIPKDFPKGDAYQINDQSKADGSGADVKNLRWQEFFTDKNLQSTIDIALKNNRDLRLAALNVEKVRAIYGIQQAELFPVATSTFEGGKQQSSSDLITAGSSRTKEQYGLTLGVASWELDLFGRIRSLKDQALEDYLATEEAKQAAQISLISAISRAYLTLAADKENLEIAKSTLANQQAAYKLIEKQHEVGIITKLDLRRAQTPLYMAREDVARFKQLVAQDMNALNLLAGSFVPESLLPSELSSITSPKEIFTGGISSEVLFNRPDIIGAEHRLKGAYAYIGAARAAFFPRISLTTSFGTASDDLSGLFGSGASTWSFIPKVSVPIFDARTWAAFRVSKAEREIALTQYEKSIQTAFKEVADNLAVKGTIDEQIDAHISLVEAASETYRLSEERYKKGIDSYLSVLDAHRSLYSAKQGLVSLRLAKAVNQVTLYAVLGGGVN
ncbi:MAG: efflux transporter outer membrane subunit [Desulfamplus sp.]|nr:efflux transporter outer membrane subunit [Desulfamplus sp.]MBF0389797.1 efflux transporter outer membrane subunit [Desulfamplus sp.]